MLARADILDVSRAERPGALLAGRAAGLGVGDRRWLDLVPTLAVIVLGLTALAAIPVGLALVAYRAIEALLG